MFPSVNVSELKVVAETEKAIAFRGWKTPELSKRCFECKVWVPKSIIRGGEIPMWFIREREYDWRCNGDNVVLELA